jgi:hypothetical protein
MAAPQKRWNAEPAEEPATLGTLRPESVYTKSEPDDSEREQTPNSKMDGLSRSEDLLDEPDEDVDAALRTGLYMVSDEPEEAEAEAKTEEFDDNETADKAASDAEKADPDDKKNAP